MDRVTGYVSKTEAQFDLRCGTLAFSGVTEGGGGPIQIAFQFFPSHLLCCINCLLALLNASRVVILLTIDA